MSVYSGGPGSSNGQPESKMRGLEPTLQWEERQSQFMKSLGWESFGKDSCLE